MTNGQIKQYMQETLERRSIWLRLCRLVWIIPLAGIACALIFGGIYRGALTRLSGQRQYQTVAKLYIDFAYNEETQKAYDYYNAATWDELLFSHPSVYEVTEKELPAGVTLAQADEMTKAELLADIRLMTLTVTAPDPETASGVAQAVSAGIVSFGNTAKEFSQITLLSVTDPEPVIVRDRTMNAVWLGLLLGLAGAFASLYLSVLLDERIYVPEEFTARLGIPVLGITPSKGVLPDFLNESLKENLSRAGSAPCLSVQGSGTAQEMLQRLKEKDPAFHALSSGTAEETEEEPVLLIRWGKDSVPRTAQYLQQLELRDVHPRGAVLCDADPWFIRKYYQ